MALGAITFQCLTCKGTELDLDPNAGPETVVHCKSCGEALGTWGKMKSDAKKAAALPAHHPDPAG
jgi:hypothetical protein